MMALVQFSCCLGSETIIPLYLALCHRIDVDYHYYFYVRPKKYLMYSKITIAGKSFSKFNIVLSEVRGFFPDYARNVFHVLFAPVNWSP